MKDLARWERSAALTWMEDGPLAALARWGIERARQNGFRPVSRARQTCGPQTYRPATRRPATRRPKTFARLAYMLCGVLLVGVLAGCSELRPDDQACVSQAAADRGRPLHRVDIDHQRDFDAEHEGFREEVVPGEPTYASYVSWDDCRIYFGFEGPAFGKGVCASDAASCKLAEQGASPHKYLMLYLDTDPLGHDGATHPQPLGHDDLRLPFKADYLVEVRTDAYSQLQADSLRFHGNRQLYRRSIRWAAGLLRHWEPTGDEGLAVGAPKNGNYLELSVDRRTIDDPCAVQAVAWIADRRVPDRYAFWPPPDTSRTADSLMLNYYGFQLLPGEKPNSRANFNRTDYNDVGRCVFGNDRGGVVAGER